VYADLLTKLRKIHHRRQRRLIYVYRSIYMNIHVYTCIYTWTHVYIHSYTHIYMYIHPHMYIQSCVCMKTSRQNCEWSVAGDDDKDVWSMHIHIYTSTEIFWYAYTPMYIHIYTATYIYIYMRMCVYADLSTELRKIRRRRRRQGRLIQILFNRRELFHKRALLHHCLDLDRLLYLHLCLPLFTTRRILRHTRVALHTWMRHELWHIYHGSRTIDDTCVMRYSRLQCTHESRWITCSTNPELWHRKWITKYGWHICDALLSLNVAVHI